MAEEDEDRQVTFIDVVQIYKVPLILGIGSIVLIVASVILLLKSTQVTTPIQFSQTNSQEHVGTQSADITQKNTITIDIEGAVGRPGVYTLPKDSRVEDAIVASGGLSDEVNQERFSKEINRAQKLVDGLKLYIPKNGDASSSYVNSQTGNAGTVASTTMVSINSASQTELESLIGVGPVTAQKIIAGRPYGSLEELVTKKTMSQSLFGKLKDQLSL